MDTRADHIGMCPVVVSADSDYKTVKGMQRAWSGFLQHVFGTRPEEEEWWMPSYGGINTKLFDIYLDWNKSLLRDADYKGVVDWHADLDIEAQLHDLKMLPCQIEESACHMCARPGDWTMVLIPLLHQEEPGGPLHRWKWLPPSAPDRDRAQRSHIFDSDEFVKRCEQLWDDYRSGMDKEEDQTLKQMEFHELCESDDHMDWIGDIETQVAEDSIMMAKEAHHPLWFPPKWLIEDSVSKVTAQSKVAEQRYGLSRRTLDLITDPLDRWLTALLTENAIRVEIGGYA